MLKEIIEEVSKRVGKSHGNIAVFNDKRYNPVDFSESNYREIGKSSGKTVLFVDGGNSELISAPGLSLQLIRNAAVIMKENKLITSKKREFYLLATVDSSKKIIGKIFHKDNEKADVIEATGGELGTFCDVVRRTSEIKFAAEAVGQLESGSIAVLDGTLQATNDMEKNHLDALYRDADTKGINVAALAKTTTLMTDQGDSYAAMLSQRGPKNDWYYYPIATIDSEHHRAEIAFSKLHERSSHVFRTELYNQQKDKLVEVIAELKENARELTFPGYPYGLILADKLARVSEKEAAYLKAKMFAAAGNKWNELRKNLAAVNAHEILDSM